MTVLLLALAAGVGVAVRFVVSVRLGGRRATLLVNVVGSALLGLLVSAPAPLAVAAVGLAGGLTTFSTWAVETVDGGGVRYALVTAAACLAAAGAGLGLAALLD